MRHPLDTRFTGLWDFTSSLRSQSTIGHHERVEISDAFGICSTASASCIMPPSGQQTVVSLRPKGAGMRILGIDPGLNTTGYGIVEQAEAGLRIVEAGTLKSRRQDVLPERILTIYSRMAEILQEFNPDGMALEDLY